MITMRNDKTLPVTRSRPRERGAALILTVVVVMILTTLALTMATFTITEERTATTYRDSMQTRSVAEAGVRIVQEMFRTPDDAQLIPVYSSTAVADDTDPVTAPNWHYWGATAGVVSTQLNEIGVWRKARTGAAPALYSGNDNRFFMGPFMDSWDQVFGGVYDAIPANDIYDVKFNCTNPTTGVLITNAATTCWLDTKINALLSPDADYNEDTGRITDISFYAPPSEGGRAYGLTTVRVTATKYDDDGITVLARETIESVIIDITPKPAVLGNGDIVFVTQAGVMCGDGCEQIHANGNANVGSISGGTDPMVSATGTVTGGSGSNKNNANNVKAPRINPWDLAYKPTVAVEARQVLPAGSPPAGHHLDGQRYEQQYRGPKVRLQQLLALPGLWIGVHGRRSGQAAPGHGRPAHVQAGTRPSWDGPCAAPAWRSRAAWPALERRRSPSAGQPT